MAAWLTAWPAPAAGPSLKYAVIVIRHGVRSPTWDAGRLNQYSAAPWPSWGVLPGELTPHGRSQMKLVGAYYRQWLVGERVFDATGCRDSSRVVIRSDGEQRTRESARALAESLLPGCDVAVQPGPEGRDPLFSGFGKADPLEAQEAVRERMATMGATALATRRSAFQALRLILTAGRTAPLSVLPETAGPFETDPLGIPKPLTTASTLSENLLLEYTEGMRGAALGWGQLTRENLFEILGLHTLYADLARRTSYLARARGSNLLAHILCSLEQAESGKPVPGALGRPGDALLVLSGHDTNLSNLSGMLGLAWNVPAYQPDDVPPSSALVFSIWQGRGSDFARLEFVAASPDQIRNLEPLTSERPPLRQEISVPGCVGAGGSDGCAWPALRLVLRKAIDLRFTELTMPPDTVSK